MTFDSLVTMGRHRNRSNVEHPQALKNRVLGTAIARLAFIHQFVFGVL